MKQRLLSLLAPMAFVLAGATAHAATPRAIDAQDIQDIRTVFLQQAAAATAHDIAAFERVFTSAPQGSPYEVTFVARAYQYWSKQAVIEHFKETFKGVWKFEPDPATIRVMPLTADSAEIYAPTQVTFGTSDATAKTSPFLVCEIAVRTPEGWRIATIIPVPAQ
jgi:hypothetical protein